MLPVEEVVRPYIKDGQLFIDHSRTGLLSIAYQNHYDQGVIKFWSPQHLYLVSDDEIKEGDWFHSTGDGSLRGIIFCDNYKLRDEANKHGVCKKVIASTDQIVNPKKVNGDPSEFTLLPHFSEDFIKAYVKANGIDEVMVEYVNSVNGTFSPTQMTIEEGKFIPHIVDINEVVISMVEEKMYSAEEVEGKLKELLLDITDNEALLYHYDGDYRDFKEWIKENL